MPFQFLAIGDMDEENFTLQNGRRFRRYEFIIDIASRLYFDDYSRRVSFQAATKFRTFRRHMIFTLMSIYRHDAPPPDSL